MWTFSKKIYSQWYDNNWYAPLFSFAGNLSTSKSRKMGNSVCKEDLEQKHVVVIGGGYGGMELAAELLKLGIPFTLIDPKVTKWIILLYKKI